MKISIEFVEPTISEDTKMHFVFRSAVTQVLGSRLKPTCANSCVAARNPFGHVVFYAPALACELRLVPHHIGRCHFVRYDFLKHLG